jgi:hypothetical protein
MYAYQKGEGKYEKQADKNIACKVCGKSCGTYPKVCKKMAAYSSHF